MARRTPDKSTAYRGSTVILWIVVALVLFPVWGPVAMLFVMEPPFYSADAIHARVVDEQGRPIPGAVVVASWESEIPLGGHDDSFHLAESVTDGHGYFDVAAWGPKLRLPLWARMGGSEPSLYIAAAGYLPTSLSNRFASSSWRTRRNSDHDGSTIVLERSGSPGFTAQTWSGFSDHINVQFAGPSCDWYRIGHMMSLLTYEPTRLRDRGAWAGPLPDVHYRRSDCVSTTN